jgi:hypothetical protein
VECTIGSTVYVEGWSTDDGFYVLECQVASKTQGLVDLKKIAVHRRDGSTPASGELIGVREAHLSIPLEQRCMSILESIRETVRQLGEKIGRPA